MITLRMYVIVPNLLYMYFVNPKIKDFPCWEIIMSLDIRLSTQPNLDFLLLGGTLYSSADIARERLLGNL